MGRLSRKPKVVLDIDGTLATVGPRLKSAKRAASGMGPDFWEKFFNPSLIWKDKPVRGSQRATKELARHAEIHYLTSRPDTPEVRVATQGWLKKWRYPAGRIHFRPPGARTVAFKAETQSKLKPQLAIGDLSQDKIASRISGTPHYKTKTDRSWSVTKALARMWGSK